MNLNNLRFISPPPPPPDTEGGMYGGRGFFVNFFFSLSKRCFFNAACVASFYCGGFFCLGFSKIVKGKLWLD